MSSDDYFPPNLPAASSRHTSSSPDPILDLLPSHDLTPGQHRLRDDSDEDSRDFLVFSPNVMTEGHTIDDQASSVSSVSSTGLSYLLPHDIDTTNSQPSPPSPVSINTPSRPKRTIKRPARFLDSQSPSPSPPRPRKCKAKTRHLTPPTPANPPSDTPSPPAPSSSPTAPVPTKPSVHDHTVRTTIPINLFSLSANLRTPESTVDFCKRYGVLPSQANCPNCHQVLTRTYGINRKGKNVSFRFQCNKKICKKSNNNQVPARRGTWFSGSNLSLNKTILLTYCFAHKMSYTDTIRETSIDCDKDGRVLETSRETVSDYFMYCREVCSSVVERDSSNMIGGPGMTVEIDESKFGKRKYHRGRVVEGQWVLGGICRESRKFFLVPVDKRDRQTLETIITDNVARGTHIITDCWKGYDGLVGLGYSHSNVNHTENFKDPVTGACTNLIENRWWCIKRQLPATHTRRGDFTLHLAEYMYRCRVDGDMFVSLLRDIGAMYPGDK